MARHAADMLDEIDELMIRLGMRFASGDPDVVFHPFDPGWCPDVALQDFNDKACVFTGGKPTMQGPFANPEVYRFPEPVGEVLICSHSHDESYTLPFFIGKGLKECDFKYAMDEQAGTLVAMGFGDPEKVIELRDGTKVRPFEVAMALTPQAEGGLLRRDEGGPGGLPRTGRPPWSSRPTAARTAGPSACACGVRTPSTGRPAAICSPRWAPPIRWWRPPPSRRPSSSRGVEVRPGVMAVEALDPLAYLKEVAAIMPLDIDVSVTTALPA